DLLQGVLGHDRTFGEVAVALVRDPQATGQLLVHPAEFELVHHAARQQPGVADAFDPHFAQHLGHDDLDVLVVDLDALAAVDVLNLAHQVVLHGFFARDAQDIVRHERPVDQRFAGPHEVAGVNSQVLAVRDEMLAFDAALATDDDRPLAAALLAQQLDHAVDLGDDRRIFRLADVAAGVFFGPHRLALDHVLVTDLAADLGQDRDAVRIPLAEDGAGSDFLVFLDLQVGAGGDFVFFQLAPFGIDQGDFAIAGEHDLLALVVADHLEPGELGDAGLLGADFVDFDVPRRGAADVKRAHRQLRTRLADALGGDDADGHPLFDQRTGRKIHAVAAAAHAERGVAGHGAADLDLFQAQLFNPAGDVERNHLVFGDDRLIGDRVHDVRPAHAAADRVGQPHLDLFAAVNHPLGDALGRAAVVQRDDHVLGDVRQLAGQVARVGRLERSEEHTLAGAVRRTEVFQHRQALAEIGFDRRFDDLARGLGHQT